MSLLTPILAFLGVSSVTDASLGAKELAALARSSVLTGEWQWTEALEPDVLARLLEGLVTWSRQRNAWGWVRRANAAFVVDLLFHLERHLSGNEPLALLEECFEELSRIHREVGPYDRYPIADAHRLQSWIHPSVLMTLIRRPECEDFAVKFFPEWAGSRLGNRRP